MKKIVLTVVPILMVITIILLLLYTTGLFGIKPSNPILEFGLWGLIIGYAASILVSIGVLLMEKGDPVKSLSWIVIMLALPGLGVILYTFLGASFKEDRVTGGSEELLKYLKKAKEDMLNSAQIEEEEIAKRMLADFPQLIVQKNIRIGGLDPETLLSRNNQVDVLIDGPETFYAKLEAMQAARHHIHVEYFIWTDDELGQKIGNVLKEKARAGVEVRAIMDGLGSLSLNQRYIKELEDAGVKVTVFRPVRFGFVNSHSNFRSHRKIIVVDGQVGFTGGINIDGKYIDGDSRLGHWRDTHLRIEGDAVKGLQLTFLRDWKFVRDEEITGHQYFPSTPFTNKNTMQVLASGPETEWDSIKQLYVNTLHSAREYVWLETPYFIPNGTIITAIKAAAQSDVDVRLIIPAKGDSRIVQAATMSFAEELLHCKVRVFQYQEGFLHSKIMVADDLICTVGSANIDIRSFDQNLEINAVMYDEKTIQTLKSQFEKDQQNSKEITLKELKTRSTWVHFKQAGSRLLAPLL